MTTAAKRALFAWALVGAPGIFAIYVWWSYRYSLARGGLPFSEVPEWSWFLAFAVSATSGVVALYLARPTSRAIAIALIVVYAIAVVAANVAIHLAIACGFGDCI